MSEQLAIRARALRHRYDNGVVLDVPQMDVPAGQALAVLGPNGAGKSTLLQVLALLLEPTEGTLVLRGESALEGGRWTGNGRLLTQRRQVTLIHQKPVLFRTTVGANLSMGLRERGLAAGEIEARVEQTLTRVGLEGFARRPARQLSGGEAQRVVLARALVLETPILLLDEPTSYLDARFRPMLEELLRERSEQGTTLVMATHEESLADALASRTITMENGHVIGQRTSDP